MLKDNRLWLGVANFYTGIYFLVQQDFEYAESYKFEREQGGLKVNRVPGVCWFTNLDHGRRHQPLPLMSMADNLKFSKHKQIRDKTSYDKYDNYDAIEVPFTDAIPSDFDGVMGVPISFLDKYSPEQFEILGSDYNIKEGLLPELVNLDWKGKMDRGYVNNKRIYSRILIRHRRESLK